MSIQTCPSCNRALTKNSEKCWNCGSNIKLRENNQDVEIERSKSSQKNKVIIILGGLLLCSIFINLTKEPNPKASVTEASNNKQYVLNKNNKNPKPQSTTDMVITDEKYIEIDKKYAEINATRSIDDFLKDYQRADGDTISRRYNMVQNINGYELGPVIPMEIMNYQILNCNFYYEDSHNYSKSCTLKVDVKTKGGFWQPAKADMSFYREDGKDRYYFGES